MRRLMALGILLCTLSSAHGKRPTQLLDQDRMVSILVDLEIARAMAQYYANDEDTARRLAKANASLVYRTHNVSPDTLKESYQYYLSHLDTIQYIYEEVIKRLEELQVQIE
jgi:hypothetical protein